MVLIAQSAFSDRLYAVERVQSGIYVLCKLGNWASLDLLERLQDLRPKHVHAPKQRGAELSAPFQNEWWRAAAVGVRSDHSCDHKVVSEAGRARKNQLCLQKKQLERTESNPVIESELPSVASRQTEFKIDGMMGETTQDPGAVFSMIKSQYQEALYASMVRFCQCILCSAY